MAEYTKAQLTEMITGKLQRNFGRTVDEAAPSHMFKACALVLRDIMSRRQMATDNQVWEGQQRQVHYLSLEFLMGRSLYNNMFNLKWHHRRQANSNLILMSSAFKWMRVK